MSSLKRVLHHTLCFSHHCCCMYITSAASTAVDAHTWASHAVPFQEQYSIAQHSRRSLVLACFGTRLWCRTVVISLLRAKGPGGGLRKNEILDAAKRTLNLDVPPTTYQKVGKSTVKHCSALYRTVLMLLWALSRRKCLLACSSSHDFIRVHEDSLQHFIPVHDCLPAVQYCDEVCGTVLYCTVWYSTAVSASLPVACCKVP